MTTTGALRDHFFGWQCRIRQVAMRQEGGRPSAGMRPRVTTTIGRELTPALTVLMVPKDPAESTTFFRFQVQKSRDPRDIYEKGLAYLQADYFQQPKDFSDTLTAVLPPGSQLAEELRREGTCVLEFDQFRQFYRLTCSVHALAADDPLRDAAIWHNRIFNPGVPNDVAVLGFRPNWTASETRPQP